MNLDSASHDLDLLIGIAQAQYKDAFIDTLAIQHGVAKTYLWIASVMFGAIIAFGESAINNGRVLFLYGQCTREFFIFYVPALLVTAIVFAAGVDSLRGRGPTEGMANVEKLCEYLGQTTGDNLAFRVDLLKHIGRLTVAQAKENNRKGRVLKTMSRLLLSSVIFSFLALASFCLHGE